MLSQRVLLQLRHSCIPFFHSNLCISSCPLCQIHFPTRISEDVQKGSKCLGVWAGTFIYLFFNIYFWLCWVFVSVRGLSLVAASGDHSSSRCAGLSLSWPLLLRSTGSRCTGSVVVAHGPSCSAARGIFPDQGSNPCPLH